MAWSIDAVNPGNSADSVHEIFVILTRINIKFYVGSEVNSNILVCMELVRTKLPAATCF